MLLVVTEEMNFDIAKFLVRLGIYWLFIFCLIPNTVYEC